MSLTETIKVAFEGIWLNKVRSFLTILGIIIGTATVIMVFAIGKGSQSSVNDQYSQLSVTTIYIMPNVQGQGSSSANSKLSVNDVKLIQENSPSITKISPQISGKVEASYNVNKQQTTVIGVNEFYKDLTNLEFLQGDYFTATSIENKGKVAVLGYDIAEILLGDLSGDYIGKSININKQKYLIAGIVQRKGESFGGTNIDESIIIPYTTAQRSIFGTAVKPRIVAQAKDIDSVGIAMEEIRTALRESHKLKPGVSDDFGIKDAGSTLASAQETSKTMSILLISVAVIVLIVGGIGIMNVMLVSIRERIKEIGTRIALGARKIDILRQFLFESIILSFMGGLIGILIGEIVVFIIQKFDIEAVRSVEGLVISIVFSGIVGVFFGFYPAQKAANLDPIDALRYE